jgi:hypothetical protein
MSVGRTFDANIVVEDTEYIALHRYDLILCDKAFAFGNHGSDFRWVDLIHFSSKQKNSDDYLLPILFCQVDRF